MTYALQLTSVLETTVVAQGISFTAAPFQPTRDDSICRITLVVSSAVVISARPTIGDGDPFTIFGGAARVANAHSSVDVALDPGVPWEIFTADAAGTSVVYLIVQELSRIA